MFPAGNLGPPGSRRAAPFSCRAFSLIELLITTAIILIMFVMLWGRSSRNFQRQQKLACQANLQTIYVALKIYAGDFKDSFPVRPGAKTPQAALGLLVPRYTTITSPFICPGTKKAPLPEGEPLEKHKISYAYYMGRKLTDASEALMSDWQIDNGPKILGRQVFSADGKKPGNNHHKYGGNFLFCDGSVQMSASKAPFSLLLPEGLVLLNADY